MQTNYFFTISAMDCKVSQDGLSNVVSTVHWRLKAVSEDNISAETYGASTIGDPDPETFVNFEDITSEQVVSWLEDVLDIEQLHASLEAQIEAIRNPVMVTLAPPFAMQAAEAEEQTTTTTPVVEE